MRLLKACTARALPEMPESADTGPCGPPNSWEPPPFVAALALETIVAPAAIVTAAPPTWDKNARRLEPCLRLEPGAILEFESSTTFAERFGSDIPGPPLRQCYGAFWQIRSA